ncbi:hypothetical protein Pla175_09240 [Pirellulimonas nuda]|uniref:DUF420 domain-containing protein n=1 Tax=Pirellulimonas nuda TaxID=2528009 RepID=A0A518D7X1_9BACT|nr:DUF420 domain-containing protein [Pirellulimonas nuda]QDU87559.1 hypothetical protein Pla175_09240 [Pirellulimonas nuda]
MPDAVAPLELLASLPGYDGFLGTRASFMLDFVFVAMLAVLPVMGWSIWMVRSRRAYTLHKWTQVTLAVVLLAAVAAFEIDMRMHGWQERAVATAAGGVPAAVWGALYVHLVFAISTAVLWPIVIARAWRRFASPPAPGAHSRSHRFWARLAAIDMTLTALTGWAFYWLAFVG